MKDRTITKYRSRKFLNRKFGMAAIQVDAHYNEHQYAQKNDTSPPIFDRGMDISVTLSDCREQVTLEFNAYDEKQRQERINKVNLIISELEKVRDVLEAGEVGERKGKWE